MQAFVCPYCGRSIVRKGSLSRHISACYKNPAVKLSKTAAIKAERESRRNPDGTLNRIHFNHSDESKKKISDARKKWLSENKDKHVWRKNSKFVSVPCENLKSLLRERGINFIEEYEPFEDKSYCIDIAWPDIKIGIEVNGNQHYNRDGSLRRYYSERHNFFESRGWKIFELHYTKCYSINIKDIEDILKLPIYDKEYVGKYFSRKEKIKIRRDKEESDRQLRKKEREINKNKLCNEHKRILINLIKNSGIDFSSHWSSAAKQYLLERGELFDINIFRAFKKYYPEFLKNENVYKRKGSKF